MAGISTTFATRLDETTIKGIQTILPDIAVPDADVWFLHAKDGGMSFTPYRTTAPAAFMASWQAVAAPFTRKLEKDTLHDAIAPATIVHKQLETLVRPKLSEQLDTLLHTPTTTLPKTNQRTLTATEYNTATTKYYQNLLNTDTYQAARARSSGGPGSAAFTMVPTAQTHQMTDTDYQLALRLRMGLPIIPLGHKCQHKDTHGNVCGADCDEHGYHALTCPKGGHLVKRHDAIKNTLAKIMQNLTGNTPLQEQQLPTPPQPASQQDIDREHDIAPLWENQAPTAYRSDITTYETGARQDLDIMITHTWHGLAMRQGRAAKQDGIAAKYAEHYKLHKYRHTTITPFVLEAHGRLGDHARQYIKHLLNSHTTPETASTEHTRVFMELSVELQRHNARAVRAALGETT
jgi:hypothetical protein